ncbi:ankyrin repeat domain-containing protein 17 isoform X3 [Diachasma alloeum]|uniref:ankyrin repeat domain-containing protein 17 isoform X3 n=1 Tax=Diachasma alloeum TaxID=454923 RepID=UPI0007384AF7|nr:ankyrin repeat domain-containing protein 17 isoform X3 [Diachasma alloeum]
MQNVAQGTTSDSQKHDKNCAQEVTSTPQSSNSSPTKSETETFSELQPRFMTDSSESEEDSISEPEFFRAAIEQAALEEDHHLESSKFLLTPEDPERSVDPETQARLEALLEAAGIGKLSSGDGKHLADHEVLRRLTSSVSCALDEAAAALTRMRSDNPRSQNEKRSLVEACTDGDVGTVRKLLTEGRSVHETTEEGESLLSLACSAGYYELAQVLLAMNANVEDRGIKGDCTPLMEAASAGHVDIVSLLIAHGADVNAQSTSGNTPLMYGCAGGHEDVVKVLLEAGANVEDHNENGHTPLMEAASAGHVPVAKILLENGAGINTHSNEFKESALTLACYKGHLDMVRFLLEAGADQEHKTDEMHTALMEASMDGHVEVARLLLDSGAQVNMPTDSFESPLTLAACGGHVDLAMLLIERGANIEEVNDEGYTPLMEAAREGHEEMVALLLSQGANINAQTEETQETALTLACCGGFLEVADFLIKAGADIELGASTPLMEAAQEGHLDLVRYLLESGADVHAQTQTGDTALTYACENGHTDVADLLLQFGADLEHESEGGRTPLMKACRAGHLCTVQFLISKLASLNRNTTNNDHTPLSLACAGGHVAVVELLLAQSADPFHKLKDNSTMLIEAAKGGHTNVVQLLLDYPHSIMMNAPGVAPGMGQGVSQGQGQPQASGQNGNPVQGQQASADNNQAKGNGKSLLRKNHRATTMPDVGLTSAEAQQVRTQPAGETGTVAAAVDDTNILDKGSGGFGGLTEPNITLSPGQTAGGASTSGDGRKSARHEQIMHKQQILEELQRVERQLQYKGAGHLFLGTPNLEEQKRQQSTGDGADSTDAILPGMIKIDLPAQPTTAPCGLVCGTSELSGDHQDPEALSLCQAIDRGISIGKSIMLEEQLRTAVRSLPLAPNEPQIPNVPSTSALTTPTVLTSATPAPTFDFPTNAITQLPVSQPHQTITTISDVSQNTAISDRPKAKPVSKKEGKNIRKSAIAYGRFLQRAAVLEAVQQEKQQTTTMFGLQQQYEDKQRQHTFQVRQVHQLQQLNQQLQLQLDQVQVQQQEQQQPQQQGVVVSSGVEIMMPSQLVAHLHPTQTHQDNQQDQQTSQLNIPDMESDLTRLHRDSACPFFAAAQKAKALAADDKVLKLDDGMQIPIDEVAEIIESITFDDVPNAGTEEQEKGELKKMDVRGLDRDQRRELAEELLSADQKTIRKMFEQEASEKAKREAERLDPITMEAFQRGYSYARRQRKLDSDLYEPQPPTRHVQPPSLDRLAQQSNGFAQPSSSTCNATTTTNVNAGTNTPTTQVQVATQTQGLATPVPTALDKKQVYTASAGTKGKKARYPLASPQTCPQQTTATSTPPASVQNYQLDPNTVNTVVQYSSGTVSTNTTPSSTYTPVTPSTQAPMTQFSVMDVDSETDSNHDTALTLACAGGHEELVEFLLSRGADIEHRDKKGFTPLILAATAGHQKVVEILLNHGADIEAQSERTKDTPLSLACSGGRFEVVELLLTRGANKEHRNVSDYTPLSLAASGGYVNIIKLLLSHGAEINSRTGSKLGISPLMLAAMNGHTAAVKLLLDMGSDINAQIETNRNTALTLACFQGRHEVVSLLLDRKANVEHRAKTGLTPLMEAASGGYVEVGRVLLTKGADVNATPVPSSRDTALTIAADKGHCRFVELLLSRGTQVEVKNKKGNSPLWLAANGGHLNVVDLLYHAGADIDSQDNRKVSCLMAAFRKGHIKVVKWMVNHVTQFPSDQEMTRYIATVNDKELLVKCQECVKVIRAAKETQAAKANKNASILLEELDMEKTREESKKAAAARRRERKKKKKLEKKEEKRKLHEENKKNETIYEDKEDVKKSEDEEERGDESDNEGGADSCERMDNVPSPSPVNRSPDDPDKEEGDSGIDANSQGSCSSNDVKARERKKEKKKKKNCSPSSNEKDSSPIRGGSSVFSSSLNQSVLGKSQEKRITASSSGIASSSGLNARSSASSSSTSGVNVSERKIKGQVFESSRHPAEREDFEATGNENYVPGKGKKNSGQYEEVFNASVKSNNSTSPKGTKREEGWKEVVRKGQSDDSSRFMNSPFRSKKVSVPPNAISRVIGRGGSNINAIRGATGAHIEVEKQSKCQGERIITIKGSTDATKQAHTLIAALIKDPDVDILQMLPKSKLTVMTSSTWDKSMVPAAAAMKPKMGPVTKPPTPLPGATGIHPSKSYTAPGISVPQLVPLRSTSSIKLAGAFSTPLSRATAPRLIAAAEKRQSQITTSTNTRTTMSYTSAIMTSGRATKVVTTSTGQTFAAKLSDITASPMTTVLSSTYSTGTKQKVINTITVMSSSSSTTPMTSPQQIMTSPKHCRTLPNLSAPTMQHYQSNITKNSYTTNSTVVTSSTVSNGPELSVNAMRVTPSPPAPQAPQSGNSQGHNQQNQSQSQGQTQSQPQAQSHQQMRSTTPVPQTHDQPQPTQQGAIQPNTPLEYSLFNDTFSKVTQQSMWGRENESHQKGMNFATVAGGGSSAASTAPPNKFIDSAPPQADASKAPGYRGTAMCSPVSSKQASNTGGSTINQGVSPGIHNPSIQPQFQSNINYIEGNKSTGLAVTRPVINQQSIELPVSMGQFNRYPDMPSRNVQGAHQQREMPPQSQSAPPVQERQQESQGQQHIMPSSSQANMEMFKNNNGGFDPSISNVNSSLLKMVPNEGQQHLMPFHPHMQSFAPSSQSGSVNTTVSMSRLNPRAPDFSSSLHVNNKHQVMFNAASGIHPNMFAVPPPPSGMQNNHAMLANFPIGKYPGRGGPAGNIGGSTNGHRWFGPHGNYPHQEPMMPQVNFHLGNIGQNMELIQGLENGGSPAMSPSSSAQVTQEMSQMKIEDRKVPRPIGTERAWKNYNAGMGPGGDAEGMNWMLNSDKGVGNWPNVGGGMERQMFRGAGYGRVGNIDAELHQMIESTFQGHMENPQAFPNGTAAGLSLMPGLTLMPGQFSNPPALQELPPPAEPTKIDAPGWGMDPNNQDKPHPGWNNKWTH